ncbi:hypothetical protein ACQKEK_02565 [Pseudomonas sp. NPDC077408]|uniref:hypothetical protein n=1 Tax=Streptomyces parvus TaxID=66428 RepID=UPI0037242009
MTIDYYISTADEQAMTEALAAAGVTDDEGNPLPGHAVEVIGTWSERTGGTDEEPVYTELPGWHVNVRSVESVEWPAGVTLSEPKTPWRVWG